MKTLRTHKRFEKDIKRALKRHRNLDKLWGIVHYLQAGLPLAQKHRPHRLSGDWFPFMECHIEPDWLLIYHITDDILDLVRTGTHADLFE